MLPPAPPNEEPGTEFLFGRGFVQGRQARFMVPDGADAQPSGGVKVLFEHAALLKAAGVAAGLIWSQRRTRGG